jgi:glycyl-tRNA synthetase beta chain
MAGELLLEVGTEEIPSGYLEDGLRGLKALAEASFEENRIHLAGDLHTYGTPRRLVLIGKDIAERQEDLVREVTGPPKSVSYDKDGRPTKAAIGFAEKQGVSVESLECLVTPKGEYVYIKNRIPGSPTEEILEECLPKIIADITWPKSMRWGSVGFSFVRPIHWVVALFNGKVIPFEVGGVRSGKTSRGHRFMGPQAIEVLSIEDYYQKMEKSFVQVDQRKREKEVERLARAAAGTVGGVPAEDAELITTVANLVEYPSAVCGSFDDTFLNIPDPVLITAMKEHQRYFSVCDEEGKLMPNFVAVNNTVAEDESVVRRGHERVLRARLSDAGFFFGEDRKRPLGERLEDLKGVIYQAELGTSYAKVHRFTRLAEYLAETVLPDGVDDVKTVARLCKCDLVTQMVNEFPSLQGVMGEEYARMEGYAEEICSAIHEHYLPIRAGGKLPTSKIGAVVGCADRLDTIAGCFAIGLEPSGSADPFALRRHSLAIIRIIEGMGWNISLRKFIEKALLILSEEIRFETDQVFERVIEFFRERYKQMMLRSDYESDLIEAVISVEFDRINQIGPRIDHLKRFVSESEEFQALALTFKRVSNILKKQEIPFDVDPARFRETIESNLWKTYQALREDIYQCLEKRDYYHALSLLARLRKPVDEFFDGAEILIKDDQALRENRVGLLQHLSMLFLKVADLSKFSI